MGTPNAIPIAVHHPSPYYTEGILHHLANNGYTPARPDNLHRWATRPSRRILLLHLAEHRDWNLLTQLAATRHLTIIALLPHLTASQVLAALNHGAHGITSTDTPPQDLPPIIEAATHDHTVLPTNITRRIANTTPHRHAITEAFTAGEIRLLQDLSNGTPIARLAADHHISESTMRRRLVSISDRLGVKTKTAAIKRATQLGLIQ